MGLSDAVIPVIPELVSLSQAPYGSFSSSLLFSGYFLGALLTMLPFGILSDRYGNEKFIALGIFLTLISGIILLVSNNFWILVVARFLEGSACGAFFPAAYSILSGFVQKKRYIGEFNFLLNAGLALGLIIAGFLADINIRGGIMVFTVMAAVLMIMSLIRLIKMPSLTSGQKTEKSDISSGIIDKVNTTATIIFDINFRKIWFMTFVLFGSTAVLVAFYPDYSADFLTKPELGTAISLIYIFAMVTSFAFGRSMMDHKTMIVVGLGIASFGALVSIRHPMAGFAILGAGSGIGMIGLPVAVSHMNIERGLAMGLFNTCTYGGLALMPIFAGVFVDVLSFEMIFALNGALLIIATLYSNRKLKRKNYI